MAPQAGTGGTQTTPRDYLIERADALGIPSDLALAMVAQESGGRQDVTSPKGAQGLFQLMPETAAELGVDATDPFQNIDGGLRYFKQQLDAHGSNVQLALAAYNAGPGAVAEAGGAVPDFPETQDYVARVLAGLQGGESPPAAAEGLLTPRAASGLSPPLTVGGRRGRFNFDVEPETGGTPYPRHAFDTEDGGRWMFQLEQDAQGGRWEEAEHAAADYARYQTLDPNTLGAELVEKWGDSGEGGQIAAAIGNAAAQGQNFEAMQQAVAGLNTHRQISDFEEPAVADPDADLPEIEGSPVSRLLSNMAEVPIEGVKGIVALARGMFTAPGQTLKAVGGALTAPTIRELEAATQARRDGDAGAWISHMLHAIPLIGPIGAEIGEQLEAGDVAGGIGRGVGHALTFAIPKALKGVRPRKPMGDIPMLGVEARPTGGFIPAPVRGFVTHLAERTLPGSGVFRRFRATQQQALIAKGEQVAADISAIPRGAVNGGQRARAMIEQTRLDRVEAAGQLYDMIDDMAATTTRRVAQTRTVPSQLVGPRGEALTTTVRKLVPQEVGGVLVEMKVLKQVAIPMLRKIKKEAQVIHPDELARTIKILEQIVRSPRRVSFGTIQAARSSLLGIVRSHGDPIPGKAGGTAKFLESHVDTVMMRAARQSGIKGLPNLVEEANALWRETKEIYNSSFLKGIRDASPETVTGLVRSADIAELQLLQKALPRRTWDEVRAGVMRDVLDEATSPPQTPTAVTSFMGRAGMTTEGLAVSPPVFSGTKLTAALRKFGFDKSVELFGRKAVDQLDDLAAYADRVKPGSTNWAATGLISAGLNASLLGPLLGPIVRPSMFLNPTVLAASAAWTASATVGFNLLAKLLTKPEGLTAYRGFLHGLSTGNRPATIAAGLQVGRLLEAEQATLDDLSDPEVAAVAGVEP